MNNKRRVRMGIGYGLLPFPDVLPFLPTGRLASWGGAGGSLVIADVDRRMTFAYVMNKLRFGSCIRGAALTTAAWSVMANDL